MVKCNKMIKELYDIINDIEKEIYTRDYYDRQQLEIENYDFPYQLSEII